MFRREEVVFSNGEIVLAGELTQPEGDGPHPAVVLISGSGAQDRDSNVFGFRMFAALADHLADSGVASLRFDDRGVGGSTGDTCRRPSKTAPTMSKPRSTFSAPETTWMPTALVWSATVRVLPSRHWWPTEPTVSPLWFCWLLPPCRPMRS